MNTNETPPDGVWFRNSPHTADTNRETGFGVYINETVQELCYAWGDSVGQYNNTLWYYVNDITPGRTTVNGHANSGYLNAHYINDGTVTNQVVAGVSQCGVPDPTPPPPPPASPPSGGSAYYSPYNGSNITVHYGPFNKLRKQVYAPSPASTTLDSSAWTSTSCSGSKAGAFTDVAANGKLITTLAGWSIGRMGPIYFVRDYPNRRSNINYIVFYDPGTLSELKGDCDSANISQTLANWLGTNSNNRILVVAGQTTRDYSNRVGNYAHQGIQQVYFPKIKSAGLSSRVTVCNYDAMTHENVWINFRDLMNKTPVSVGSCPTALDGTRPNAQWNP